MRNKSVHKCIPAVLLVVAALAATGCRSPTVVVLENPRTFVEERGIFVAREDARIMLDIQALYIEEEVGKLKNISVEVYEKAVMLTGTVSDPTAKDAAGALAATVKGANPVHNEILVLPDASLRNTAADLAIETKIKKALRADDDVHSVNMRWHSVNGTVFMFGRALSEAERKLALKIVGNVFGVKNIVDRMKMVPRS